MDRVADFLTRIRNANMVGHQKLDVFSSQLCEGLAEVLKNESYIKNFKVVNLGQKKFMRVYLNSDEKTKIRHISRYSKPSKRVYTKASKIPKIRSGYGLCILSTNKGILSGKQARKQNVGGEILCRVW